MKVSLYPHQQQSVDELEQALREGHRHRIYGAATGSGKTVVAGALIDRALNDGRKTWFICDRLQLIDQAVEKFRSYGFTVGVVQADNTMRLLGEDVVVASIQTLSRRRPPDDVGLVIVDEVHVLYKAHRRLLELCSNLPAVGLSATPMRQGLGRYYSRLIRGPLIRELIEQGYLVPFKCYGPSSPDLDRIHIRCGDYIERELSQVMNRTELIGDIVSTWQTLGENRKTIAFAVDIAHSKAIAAEFQREGINAVHMDAYTPPDERREIIKAFRSGDVQVLSSVAILSLGFDAPEASCVISARPTLSEGLFMQQAGRGPRLAPGKTDVILLDHAGNCARHGLPQNFETPPLDESTEGPTASRRTKERKAAPCPECKFMITPEERECPNCGWLRVRKSNVHFIDGQLTSLDADFTTKTATEVHKLIFYAELLGYAKHKGYKRGWAWHKFNERFGYYPKDDQYLNMLPREPSQATLRWIQSRIIAWRKAQSA